MFLIYENFNTTNQTQPRFEAHENFVADIKEPGCSLVSTLPFVEQCAFVNNEKFCNTDYQLINYINFYFCTLSPTSIVTEIFAIIVLCLILAYEFLMLGIIADKFFCPALTMLSKIMRMSEALAGVTILAFGNGAPDLFTAMASLNDTTVIGLEYGELIGAAAFVTAVVGGSIIVTKPFKVFATSCTRDYLVLIFTILYLDTILYTDGMVTMAEAIGLIIIYVIYIIIIGIDQYILSQSSKENKKKRKTLVALEDNFNQPTDTRVSTLNYEKESTILFLARKSLTTTSLNSDSTQNGVLKQFLKSINPIDLDEWKEAGYCGKFCKIIQLPLIIFTLTIPIADYDSELDGWTKLLNCLQLIFFVPLTIKLTIDESTGILNLTNVLLMIGIMIPVAVFIFTRTSTNKIPHFHYIYSIIASCISIGYISYIANEIINILIVLGIVLNANSSFLGCTLLAWGNSMGDLVTNITLAKQGYEKMGFAACIGGPLFNILMSCGVTFIYKAYNNPGANSLSAGALSTTNSTFLLIILCFTLLTFLLTEFQARRSIGILLIILYVLCFFYTITATFEIIHAYGTDHSEETGV